MINVKNHQKLAMVRVEKALGRKSQPCWTQLAAENHRQCLKEMNGLSPSSESNSAVSNGDILAIKNIVKDTATPFGTITIFSYKKVGHSSSKAWTQLKMTDTITLQVR